MTTVSARVYFTVHFTLEEARALAKLAEKIGAPRGRQLADTTEGLVRQALENEGLLAPPEPVFTATLKPKRKKK